MKVLVISGDPAFAEGNERYELHKQAVERLDVFRYKGIFSGPIGFLRVLSRASRTRYDVIISQEPFWRGLLAWLAARMSGARSHIQVHVQIRSQGLMKRMLARFVLKRADSIRVVSKKLKGEVEKVGIIAPISVLPVYLDLDRFKNIERTPHENPTILWVGRFEDEKDPLLAVYVFKKVKESVPNAQLVMLGTGSLEKILKQRTRGLPVEFPGWQDTALYLKKAHIVLSTSPAESWGASIVEALAAGVPVVSRDVGIAKEAGAIVAEKGELADNVIEVLHSPPKVELKIPVLSKEEWISEFRKTL